MDPELFEKTPVRKWSQLTNDEQKRELEVLRQSRYFRNLPSRIRSIINIIT